MKHLIKITFLLIGLGLFFQPLVAQENRSWSAGTAYTVPQGVKETGLFQPVRYASSSTREWIYHPLLFPIYPNIAMKQQWKQYAGGQLSYRLGFQFPTMLLRAIRKNGTGGILANDHTVPQMPAMFRLRGELLYSKPFSQAILMTYKSGLALAIGGVGTDTRTTIDLPVIYPRMAVYYNGYQFNAGIDALWQIKPKLSILIDGDILWTPGWDYPLAFENKLLFAWYKSETFVLQFGWKHSIAKYPFGAQQHLIPIFDIMWSKKKK